MKIDIVMHWKKQCIGVATVIAVLVSPIVAFGDTPAANCPQLTTCPAADLLTIPGSTCTNLCTTYTNGTNVVNGTYECVQGPTVCAKWTPPADCPQLTTCPPEVLNTTPGFTCDSKCTTFTNGKNIVHGAYDCVQGSTVCTKWIPPADCPQLTVCPPAELITTPGSTCENMCTTYTNGTNIVNGAYDCVQGSTVCTKWIPPTN